MSQPGDSGSPVILNDGTLRAVAINFAGNTGGTGFIFRIATVLAQLNVSLCSDISRPPLQWTAIPGATPSSPTLAWNPSANELQMVVRATDDSIWVSSFNSSGVFNNDWAPIPGATPSSPALAWNPVANELQIVVRASNDSIWAGTFNSSGVFNNDWAPIPGATPSSPALAWNPVANELQIVVRASNDSIW